VKHVLITGGLGFLGSALVTEFAAAGFNIRIFSRQGRRAATFVHPSGYPIIWGDIRDREAVNRATEGVNLVVHTVSNFRQAKTDRDAYAINVGGTDNLFDACAKQRVERIVLCSTIGVHGNVAQVPATEESPYNPGDIYQETKVEVERRARAFEQEHGIPICILRPASLYGPGDLRMLKLFRMIQQHRFVMMGSGRANFHPAYIDDVARAFVLAAVHPRVAGETFIVGGDGFLPLRDLVKKIARHLRVSPPVFRLPLKPVEALAAACEVVCRPLNIEPPLHRRRMSFFRNNRGFSIDKARRLLGYAPQVGLDEGLERTIAWYESGGLLARRPSAQPAALLTSAAAVVGPEGGRSPDTTRSSL
jgi:nucleoside-diphosphate-sugar epimerase